MELFLGRLMVVVVIAAVFWGKMLLLSTDSVHVKLAGYDIKVQHLRHVGKR
jgi:hypothetical protein